MLASGSPHRPIPCDARVGRSTRQAVVIVLPARRYSGGEPRGARH